MINDMHQRVVVSMSSRAWSCRVCPRTSVATRYTTARTAPMKYFVVRVTRGLENQYISTLLSWVTNWHNFFSYIYVCVLICRH